MKLKSPPTVILIHIRIFLVIVVCQFISPAHAQYYSSDYSLERTPYEFNLLGSGARAAGMAYAYNAVADDASGIYWNPGGTAFIKDPQYTLSGRGTTSYISRDDFVHVNSTMTYFPDFAGIVFPLKLFKKTLSLGAAYQNMMTREAHYYGGGNMGRKELEYKNFITVNAMMFSAAYAFSGTVYFGGTYNRWFSLGNKLVASTYTNEVANGFQRLSLLSASRIYTGNNFSLGTLIDLSSKGIPLRIGLKFESPFKLKAEVNQTDSVYYVFNYDSLVAGAEVWQGTLSYNMPMKLSLGVSYRLGDYLTIAADYDIKPFGNATKEWDGRHYNNMINEVRDTTFSYEYSLTEGNANLNQWRIGMEYILHPRELLIPIRLGMKSNRTSLARYDSEWNVIGNVRGASVNCGFGWIMEGFSIDFAYEMNMYFRYIGDFYENRIYNYFSLSSVVNL